MVFSIPSYLGLGDRPQKPYDPRAHGGTFLVGRPKTGHNPDALIDKEFRYLWNGERGGDVETMRRRELMESAKKNLTSNGFVYSSPPQKGEGVGSYYGCIDSTPYPHAPAHPEKHEQRVARRELGPRGIYTSPAKKGTGYGYAHLGLSDVGTDYIATIYDQPAINAREERELWRSRMPQAPFVPAMRRGYTFDEALATGVSRCYTMDVPFREKKEAPEISHYTVDAPWRPAGAIDDSRAAGMEYWEDPYRGYDPRLEPKAYVKKPSEEVFYPSKCCDNFWYTQSVVFKRL